ncbi:uncharacterized protein LOC114540495 [Dendronephthya gigantea]|uniref:uncharacterized protein LOC114540495 n=1 Tax=Dendronephthya gigantea TaxID=151771 RepID=UPI00106A3415|nr:uncharacterized protein LOC114540495 [Dendronephthya gigantea]
MFRIVAWLLTACYKFKSLGRKCESVSSIEDHQSHITVLDQTRAKEIIVRHVQCQAFSAEIFDNESSSTSRKGSRLSKLKPFVQDCILRVGGRLKHSDLAFYAKHPIIMPGKHHVTKKIILYYHILNGHVETHQTLAAIRQRYWILKGVASVRSVLHNCHECKRQSARCGEQIMAPLPPVRVSSDSDWVTFPFSAVGVDYFGPFHVTCWKSTRSAKSTSSLNKRYGCIFTCLRYRAVHIEIANDLSTESFINAVLRFVARRGPLSIIYSDNGTNFRGAEIDIFKAMGTWNQERIRNNLHEREIGWRFNPPVASHYGGIWERLIRSIRRILHAMIGEQLVNEETLTTFIVEVEKIMNDRPITPVPSEAEDLTALTPNDILLLRRNPRIPLEDERHLDQCQTRWKQVHHLANQFYNRWVKEYLSQLQESQKWLKNKPNFQVGDLVLVTSKDTVHGKWPKGLVQEVYPDEEGVVRRVMVRTATGTYQRDIQKLCMLEEQVVTSFREQLNSENKVKLPT